MAFSKGHLIDVHDLLRRGFTETTARELYAMGPEVVIFVMLQLVSLALQSFNRNEIDSSTPSGSIPSYQKKPSKRRVKVPGAQSGHPGFHRPPPEKVTRYEVHRAS
jgi:hypothetical protein